MRWRFLVGGFAIALLGFALLETDSQAQFGGFDFKDPKNMFSRYAQGQGTKDYIEIDKVQSRMDPELPTKMKAYAAKAGISNGKMTLDQFSEFWTKDQLPAIEAKMAQGGGFGGRGFGGPQASGQKDSPMGGERSAGNADPNKAPLPPLPPLPPLDLKEIERSADEKAKEWFFRRDRNRDGVLSEDEVSDEMKAEKGRWDANKNGLIEYDEFVAYARDRVLKDAQERQRYEEFKRNVDTKGSPSVTVNPNATGPNTSVIEERKNVIIRADNLPRELPSWFKELDTDKDAQVGLYEWRVGNKDFEEFRKNDRNGDGFITVEEVLWFAKNADRLAGGIPTTPAIATPTVAAKDRASGTEERGKEKGEKVKDEKGKDEKVKDGKGKDSKWAGFGGFGKDSRTKDAPAKDAPAKDK